MGVTNSLHDLLSQLTPRAVLDILVVAAGIYFLLRLLRGARAMQAVAVIAVVAVLYEVARWARLEMVEWLLGSMAPYAGIALIVLYQSEIRRSLARLGQSFTFSRIFGNASGAIFDDVVMAAEY